MDLEASMKSFGVLYFSFVESDKGDDKGERNVMGYQCVNYLKETNDWLLPVQTVSLAFVSASICPLLLVGDGGLYSAILYNASV